MKRSPFPCDAAAFSLSSVVRFAGPSPLPFHEPGLHFPLLLHFSVFLDGIITAQDVEPADFLLGRGAVQLVRWKVGEVEELLDSR